MKTLLTIDWDYFVPLKPEYDFGHQESSFFRDIVWTTRGHYEKKIKPTRSARTFWKDNPFTFTTSCTHTWVSDSHLHVYDVLHNVNEIILMDAHHDAFLDDPNHPTMDCGNWVVHWLMEKSDRRLTWVYPEWLPRYWGKDFASSIGKSVANRIRITRLRDLEQTLVDRIHVCRSSCWTPPWCDRAFQRFVSASMKQLDVYCHPPWDGYRLRWGKREMESMRCETEYIYRIMNERAQPCS